MEFITLILVIWVFVLSLKVGDHTKRLEQVQKTLTRFKPVGKKKTPEQTTEAPSVPDSAQPMHASGVVEKEIPTEAPIEQVSMQEAQIQEPQESFENVLIKKILPTIGVLSVLLAIIFIVTWSYTNKIIGPGTLLAMAAICLSRCI